MVFLFLGGGGGVLLLWRRLGGGGGSEFIGFVGEASSAPPSLSLDPILA